MNEEDLIKQKMKETKKQINSGSIGYAYGIILSIIQAISSFIIPKDTQWFEVTLISYMGLVHILLYFFKLFCQFIMIRHDVKCLQHISMLVL